MYDAMITHFTGTYLKNMKITFNNEKFIIHILIKRLPNSRKCYQSLSLHDFRWLLPFLFFLICVPNFPY